METLLGCRVPAQLTLAMIPQPKVIKLARRCRRLAILELDFQHD